VQAAQNGERRVAIGGDYRGRGKKRCEIAGFKEIGLPVLLDVSVHIANIGESLGAQQLLCHELRSDADAWGFAEAHRRRLEPLLGGKGTRDVQ
jgi:hypothetical protein